MSKQVEVPESAVEAAVRTWSVDCDSDDLETALRDVLRAAAPLIHGQDQRRFPDGTYCICPEHDLLMPYRFVHWEWTAAEGCPVLMDGENVCGEPVQIVDPTAAIYKHFSDRLLSDEALAAAADEMDSEELRRFGVAYKEQAVTARRVVERAARAASLRQCSTCDDTGFVCAECRKPRSRCSCGLDGASEDGCPTRCAALQAASTPEDQISDVLLDQANALALEDEDA